MSNRTNDDLVLDADTQAFFNSKPVWYVTTLTICEKCGRAYKASIGHKPENCVPIMEAAFAEGD